MSYLDFLPVSVCSVFFFRVTFPARSRGDARVTAAEVPFTARNP